MVEYQKIPTLYTFDSKIKRFVNKIYDPLVDYLKGNEWLCSEKINGMNISVTYDGHRVSWNGRTEDSELPKEVENILRGTFEESEIIFEQMFGEKEVHLFMECYGGKLQGGIYGGKERLVGFDVMVDGYYLDKMVIKDIFEKFGVACVHLTVVSHLSMAIDMVKYWMEHNSVSQYCEDGKQTMPEGLVCVPAARLYDHQGNRVIVKIKVRDLKKTIEVRE